MTELAPPKPRLPVTPAGTSRDVREIGYAPKDHLLQGRQLAVAQLVALGLADKEIAHFLKVSQGTVKGHVSLILRQLGLFRRTQICRFVYETGLAAPGQLQRPRPIGPQTSGAIPDHGID